MTGNTPNLEPAGAACEASGPRSVARRWAHGMGTVLAERWHLPLWRSSTSSEIATHLFMASLQGSTACLGPKAKKPPPGLSCCRKYRLVNTFVGVSKVLYTSRCN
ncbi:hypothetical protein E2C01_092607 [Portunus trituberculatus]|uniref:Uncharacterized protein n=1 Tax=Portunus trituberculatus TaxID=210409 RepID=A0A5B7JKP8_PORTR|nr:hypothetical protein [Portunus trituberculatus]